MASRTTWNFWLDLVSFIAMLGLAATGVLVRWVLPPGSGSGKVLFGFDRHGIGEIHFWFAAATVALVAVHLLMHWRWVCSVAARPFGGAAASRRARTAWGLAVLAGTALFLAGGGIWAAGQVVQKPLATGQRATHGDEHAPRALPQRESHTPTCPEGDAITGRNTLAEAARAAGMGVEKLKEELGLPVMTGGDEPLGQLRRRHGFEMQDVRELICR